MRRDDHFVSRECPKRILYGEIGIGVTDLARDAHAEAPDRLDRALEPSLGFLSGLVDVAKGVLQTRLNQRWGDDTNLDLPAARPTLDLLQKRPRSDCLV